MATVIKIPRQLWSDLLANERKMREAFSEFDKAEKCGIDCNPLRQAVQEQLTIIDNIKAEYGPKQ